MATIKVKFRAPSAAGGCGALFYQVIHRRVARQVRTDIRLFPEEWDSAGGFVAVSAAAPGRREYVERAARLVAADLGRLRGVVSLLDCRSAGYTADDVVRAFAGGGFLAYGMSLAGRLRRMGKERTADTYVCALRSLGRFMPSDVALSALDSDMAVAYEAYLKAAGLCPNTTSFYMRNLRAIYNRAVEEGLTPQRNPFRRVYTGVGKTVKRAVGIDVIRSIKGLDLSCDPLMDYARDIFLFSFYTRGMSFVDMAFLRKSDLRGGILTYCRRKTRQRLFVKWEPPMQRIVEKYDTAATPFLLPIIRDLAADCRRQYLTAAHLVNAKLKRIGEMLGLSVPLTTYVARHSWASAAKRNDVAVSVISEAMGHDSETTTRIYLASLDTSVIDRANSRILAAL